MAEKTVTLNVDAKLFVIPCGEGYTCYGFENCHQESQALAKAMGLDAPSMALYGTLEGYELYRSLIDSFKNHIASRRTWFAPDTDSKVKTVLERYRNDGGVLRLFLGDPSTGLDWGAENDVVGTIGRSCGITKVPLLVAVGDDGGGAISTNHIVRIIDVATNRELYRHKLYQLPNFTIGMDTLAGHPEYTWAGYRDGQTHARFRSVQEAAEWKGYMLGEIAATNEQLREMVGHARRRFG